MSPHQVTADFEKALCEYVGSPFAVTTNSCTMSVLLAVAYHLNPKSQFLPLKERQPIEMPRPGYISIPQSIIHAGGRPTFRDEDWSGCYQLRPLPVWDFARRFTSGMYIEGQFQCTSFHASKILGLEQGGCIFHDDPVADKWFRRARFDGRTPGVNPKDDVFDMIGWHCYINPSTAAQGILRLYSLAKNNKDLENDDYPSMDTIEVFK